MIGICASFTCQSGKNAEFETLLSEFATTVKANEPGPCLSILPEQKE
jgi:hypothetical protein